MACRQIVSSFDFDAVNKSKNLRTWELIWCSRSIYQGHTGDLFCKHFDVLSHLILKLAISTRQSPFRMCLRQLSSMVCSLNVIEPDLLGDINLGTQMNASDYILELDAQTLAYKTVAYDHFPFKPLVAQNKLHHLILKDCRQIGVDQGSTYRVVFFLLFPPNKIVERKSVWRFFPVLRSHSFEVFQNLFNFRAPSILIC